VSLGRWRGLLEDRALLPDPNLAPPSGQFLAFSGGQAVALAAVDVETGAAVVYICG
jgi:hypothetical protein